MPGLVPAIHVLLVWRRVDGRVKPGHDDGGDGYASSLSAASTTLRASSVRGACGGTGSPTS
ncbi:hypothetical protein F8237_09160 [Bradyrhizobium betae]|uniref:Uncharacterized protein n=1 Tax=Bradyrhizobium betae TaxID=244734 RepID=A0A5P6P2W9_9BRAD|nr:hypothetical protein F8237_09160 [Bradyrhizobium betae]